MTDKQKNFIVRTITGTLFVAIMVAGFLNPRAMVFLFALITGLSMWEYTGLVNGIDDVRVNRFISTVAGVYLFLAVAAWRMGVVANFIIVVPYLLTIVYLFVSGLFTCNKNPVADWAYTMLGQMYVALPLSMINILAFEVDGQWGVSFDPLLPLSIFIFLWTNDSGAYCCGSLLGKHKLFPRVSPGKSWEGSIGGCVLVLAVAALIGWWANSGEMTHQLSIAAWMGLGLVVVVFARWETLSRASSSVLSASRTAATCCQDTAACSTALTRQSWQYPLPLYISTPLPCILSCRHKASPRATYIP